MIGYLWESPITEIDSHEPFLSLNSMLFSSHNIFKIR